MSRQGFNRKLTAIFSADVEGYSRMMGANEEATIATLTTYRDVNMSGDPSQEYFSDGSTEQIITDICQIRDLFVIARNSSFAYKGTSVNVQQISRGLGVRYVREGSVQKAGERVRITAQFIDAQNGHHLWADNYDRELQDIFAIQDEITIKFGCVHRKSAPGRAPRLGCISGRFAIDARRPILSIRNPSISFRNVVLLSPG